MTAEWWPEATRRPVRWAGSTHAWAAPPLGWILHVVVGNGSPFAGFDGSKAPGRKFSHWWVAKDGQAEQYAPASVTSWAQGAGNGTYWSVETEGMPSEPLTGAQLDTLARLHRWLGAADQLAASPGQRGIGTHWMGGAAWGDGKTPHTCPDPDQGLPGPRSHQRAEIIRLAQSGVDDMTPEQISALVKQTADATSAEILGATYGTKADGKTPFTLAELLGEVRVNAAKSAAAADIVLGLASRVDAIEKRLQGR